MAACPHGTTQIICDLINFSGSHINTLLYHIMILLTLFQHVLNNINIMVTS